MPAPVIEELDESGISESYGVIKSLKNRHAKQWPAIGDCAEWPIALIRDIRLEGSESISARVVARHALGMSVFIAGKLSSRTHPRCNLDHADR